MSASNTDSIRTTVIGGVLTTVIGAALGAVWAWMPGVWAWLMRLVGNMYAHFAGHATVPVWSLYLGYGALGLWILAFGIHVVQQWRDNEPRTTDYTSDRFFGIVWRWSYPGGTMSEPRAYCPSCDTTLVYSENREYGEWRTHFYCETCQKECHDAQGGRAYVIAKVVRQVDRKLRNGEWKPIVENARQSDTTTT